MKAIISTTYSDTYLYFLPIVTFCWNRLGVDVICFMPDHTNIAGANPDKLTMILHTCMAQGLNPKIKFFKCPEHKEATYSQCSRLYAGCLDLPEDEVIITGDVDMGIFRTDFIYPPKYDFFDIYGYDLVPQGQLPMCYAVATVSTWRKYFTKGRTYQECLDAELAHEECENMRGNLWCRDQELLYKGVGEIYLPHRRSNGENQFAMNRVDRTDLHYKDRLDKNIIDVHFWRDGYTDENFPKILELLQYFYPNENFDWLISYNEQYKQLL